MGITPVCSPQCSLKRELERSSFPLFDGYHNGLLTAIVIEECVRSLITSAHRWASTVCTPQCSLNSAADRSSLLLVDDYIDGLCSTIVIE